MNNLELKITLRIMISSESIFWDEGGFPNSTFSDVFNDFKEVKTIVKWKAIVTEISKWSQSIMKELALSLCDE